MRRQSEKARQRRSESNAGSNTNTASTSSPSATKTVRIYKTQRLDVCDVSDVLVRNNIRTEAGLMSEALKRSERGENDLNRFVLSRTSKSRADLIAWKIQEAPTVLERSEKNRISIIK